jgi:hypothetical protein
LKIEPNFPDTVIVLVKNKQMFTWYVSEKEMWIMDLLQFENAFHIRFGEPTVSEATADYEEREGCEILSEANMEQFQEAMQEYEVSYGELAEYFSLYSQVYGGGIQSEFEISFYLDVDNKTFYSFFSEPGSYEEFVPEGWMGIYELNAGKIIPEESKRS